MIFKEQKPKLNILNERATSSHMRRDIPVSQEKQNSIYNPASP